MAIRKFGTEPAKTETRADDNDAETLSSLAARGEQLPQEISDQIGDFLKNPETCVRRGRPQSH